MLSYLFNKFILFVSVNCLMVFSKLRWVRIALQTSFGKRWLRPLLCCTGSLFFRVDLLIEFGKSPERRQR